MMTYLTSRDLKVTPASAPLERRKTAADENIRYVRTEEETAPCLEIAQETNINAILDGSF